MGLPGESCGKRGNSRKSQKKLGIESTEVLDKARGNWALKAWKSWIKPGKQ
jgi:hypothetical protein